MQGQRLLHANYGTPPPQSRTVPCTTHRNQGSTGFWCIKEGSWHKNQGLHRNKGEREKNQKRRHRDDNIENKTVASDFQGKKN